MSSSSQSWECVAVLRGHSNWIYGVPITPNGMLASTSGSKILYWNLSTQEVETVFEGHTSSVLSLSLSPDGQTLASGSLDKTVGLWNLEARELICTLADRRDPIHAVTFSPDGKSLASGGESKYKTADGRKTTIYLWDVESKKLIRTFSKHDLRVNTLVFSPDGKTLVSGSNDFTVRVWDVNLGTQLHVLEGHTSNIATVAFTPNGRSLVSSGGGGVKVWNVQTGELEQTFAEKSEYIRCFAVNPGGQLLAFGVDDGIEVWNLESGEKLQYLPCNWSTSINFSADGKLLASGDATAFTEDGGLVTVWRVPDLEVENDSVYQDFFDKAELSSERQRIELEGYFNAESFEDARQRIIASIVQRQGQSKFRQKLLTAYHGQCLITGCNVEPALEAAHIIPYKGADTNHPANGLLLRADIHTLFDLHLISVKPETYEVVIAPDLTNTCYAEFAGKKLNLPQYNLVLPDQTALTRHYELFLEKNTGG